LPDGIKSKFGYIFEGLEMRKLLQFSILMQFVVFNDHLVYFVAILVNTYFPIFQDKYGNLGQDGLF
jgi:hypothetical protein